MLLMRICLWLLLCWLILSSNDLNLYATNEDDQSFIGHDCLFYRVPIDLNFYYEDTIDKTKLRNSIKINHQLIPYCFRELSNSTKIFNKSKLISNRQISFFELSEKEITSEDLYKWSITIDIIEDYEYYLMNKDSIDGKARFLYNCSYPNFGSFCQYRFYFDELLNFSQIVQKTMGRKSEFDGLVGLSCYMHINCIRGPKPICLDWREICDHKIDCFNGEDEDDCWQLELIECRSNEYRCQNGQCIPMTYFQDNPFNPDCLDRSDEPIESYLYPLLCILDPSFRCEDAQCRRTTSRSTVCGNGQCVEILDDCDNHRNGFFLLVLFEETNLLKSCIKAMQCLLISLIPFESTLECRNYCFKQYCLEIINRTCPEEFVFPSYPILFGHIYFLYRKNQLIYLNNQLYPNFVCYNSNLCNSNLFSQIIYKFNQSTCSSIDDLINLKQLNSIFDFYRKISNRFYSCSSRINVHGFNDCVHQSLFHCRNTSKCISKHRLVDGISDCPWNDDELYESSCSLDNQSQRFHCSNKNKTKCYKLHQYNNGIYDCTNEEDEISLITVTTRTKLSFQTICDGFEELTAIFDNGKRLTDETDCSQWQCNNIYTRCDFIWNCQDGSDEINCECSHGQLCLSIETEQLICLPPSQVNDGSVDCVGGSDERHLCRMMKPHDIGARFYCGHFDDTCINVALLCDTKKNCLNGVDEKYCEHFIHPSTPNPKCTYRILQNNLTQFERFLCRLTEENKRKQIYFSLNQSTTIKTFPILYSNENRKKRQYRQIIDKYDEELKLCQRGLPIQVRFLQEYPIIKCLCPPSYYGSNCQYQNQRISLTLRFQTSPPDWYKIFSVVVMLIENDHGLIESTDQLIYNHFVDCQSKFDINLLYSTRPKNLSKTFHIRIDAFDKQTLLHRSSWIFPIEYSFLPVYRLSTELNISLIEEKQSCLHNCSNHGQCFLYENNPNQSFCLCNHGWSGLQCSIQISCHCSNQSKCLSSSSCICPLTKFGSRCLLTDSTCRQNPCQNNATCFSSSIYHQTYLPNCICLQGYSGQYCERSDRTLIINFNQISIPTEIFVHLIQTFPSSSHKRSTIFQRSTISRNNFILPISVDFHLIFVEFQSNYYLLFANETQKQTLVETEVNPSKRCSSTIELFNQTFVNQHLLIVIKYYHLICRNHQFLTCFFDKIHMCLCDNNRQANCLEFTHQMPYDCRGFRYCDLHSKCFQNDLYCPTSMMCVCDECYYGSRCQFSTIGNTFSLDVILGYHILPEKNISQQTLIVQISISISILLALFGFISAYCSLITFRQRKAREVGCGYYLYTSAINLILIMCLFLYKFWFLLLSQMLFIRNQSILLIHCQCIEYFLRSCFTLNDWLNACVAIERAISSIQGIQFNKKRSIQIAKRLIILIIILTFVSHIYDPYHRQLMNDEEENRIWCITKYSNEVHILNSVLTSTHFLIPFSINIFSSIIIIIKTVQRQVKLQVISNQTEDELQKALEKRKRLQRKLFFAELKENLHILISPLILIILALPKLVITYFIDCMKSQREPSLFLIAYFISFLPSSAHFIIFVLPSRVYKQIFSKAILRIRQQFRLR